MHEQQNSPEGQEERLQEVRRGEPEALERVLHLAADLCAELFGQMKPAAAGPLVEAINDGRGRAQLILDCQERVSWVARVLVRGQPDRIIASRAKVGPANVVEIDLFKAVGTLATEMIAELSPPERAMLCRLMVDHGDYLRFRIWLGATWSIRLTALKRGRAGELHIGTLTEAADGPLH